MDETSRSDDGPATVATARERLAAAADPLDRTETLPVGMATDRTLAAPVTAARPLPHHDRAAVDGFALRAADTEGAAASDPARLTRGDDVTAGTATRVDAGDPVPDGATAIVPLAAANGGDAAGAAVGAALDSVSTGEAALVVERPVAPGTGIERAGAQFEAGETVLPAGRRVRSTDPALCAAVGRTRVEAVQRPTIGVVPTGDGLTAETLSPGDVVETNGRTLSALAGAWGGNVTYRDGVEADTHALRAAVQRDLTKDLLVTTGGTGHGERDRLYDVVGDLGRIEVRTLALEPGGTAGVAVVQERPVVLLPGDPAACLVAARQLLGPAVTRLAHRPEPDPPTVEGRLAAPVESEVGTRTVVPVALEGQGGGTEADDAEAATETEADSVRPLAAPADAGLEHVARADGWLVVSESDGGRPAGDEVTVELWDAADGRF